MRRQEELQDPLEDSDLSSNRGMGGVGFNPGAKLELLLSAGNENVAGQNLSHSLCLSLYSGLNSGISCCVGPGIGPSVCCGTSCYRSCLHKDLDPTAQQPSTREPRALHDWQFRWRLWPVTNVQNATLFRNLTIFLVHT